jgi:hypothetical protein
MAPAAAYDEIADWYEREFLAREAAPGGDRLGVGRVLRDLLGPGGGGCLEIGCGTGVRAALRPGGVFVHVGVHPCFCGGFAERGDPAAVVIRPVLGIRARRS